MSAHTHTPLQTRAGSPDLRRVSAHPAAGPGLKESPAIHSHPPADRQWPGRASREEPCPLPVHVGHSPQDFGHVFVFLGRLTTAIRSGPQMFKHPFSPDHPSAALHVRLSSSRGAT